MRFPLLASLVLVPVILVTTSHAPNAAERTEIPERYTWNLADLYPGEASWVAARDGVLRRIPEVERFKGKLGESADTMLAALGEVMDLDRDLSRLRLYASMLHDQDTRIGKSLEMLQSAELAIVKFRTAAAYVQPEILAMDEAKVRQLVESDARLGLYRHFFDDLFRRKPHTLSPSEEKLAARASDMADAGAAVHGVFTNAELPYPEVTLSTGEKVRLDAQGYTRYRALPSREDRRKVFRAFWSEYAKYSRTLGTTLFAQVKAHVFNKDVRSFGSSLEASLHDFNIPTSVYRRLVSDVRANLPTLHRYLDLRRRMMGLEKLGYEDLYAPIVKNVDLRFTPDEASNLVIRACEPLGKDYVAALRKGLDGRWVDFLPSTGKRSGAYSDAAYGVHPYQLQNFMGLYDDVSTLAHEFGHSIHSLLTDTTQPYVYRNYSTFVAEVASTLNESLLFHRSLQEAKDDATRLFLLGSRLELLRTTLFRQTLFAEFELKIHEMAEKGETLTGENLTAAYLELVKAYYGDAAGVCGVDDLYGVEWAYIPHFYYNFYVYQYATSLVASISISDAILEEAGARPTQTKQRDAYLKMLASGASKYPITLLREVGVDMTTSKPFASAMKEMNRIMDQMEAILAKGAGAS